jgi:xanthine dehydrogenase molybdopterin binding subunit
MNTENAGRFTFTLNGETVEVSAVSADTTLLDWLRHSGRVGTKCGCNEGDCGACTVALLDTDAQGRPAWRAINSCIALLTMFAGRELVTVEGVANGAELHPVQACMVKHYGSQCGYCTPGFVMSMFEGYYRDDLRERWQIADQLCGNLCRCTGYRPIRDAALEAFAQRTSDDRFAERLREASPLEPFSYERNAEAFFRPLTLADLLVLKRKHLKAVFVAGATEIGVLLNKRHLRFPVLISTEGVAELREVSSTSDEWRIGAAATLTAIEEALGRVCEPGTQPSLAVRPAGILPAEPRSVQAGSPPSAQAGSPPSAQAGSPPSAQAGSLCSVAHPVSKRAPGGELPSFGKMLRLFASRQIRSRATLGGNLATASPIGDSAPVLLSLDASLVLASEAGERCVPLSEFFTGYRKTVLREGEVIKTIVVPRVAGRRAEFFKVSKRREMDISTVAAAFCIETDANGVVTHARLAFGGVAPTTVRALRAEQALLGRTLEAAHADVLAALRAEFTPIDDARGSAEFRRGLVTSLWKKFVLAEEDEEMDFCPGAFQAGAPQAASSWSTALEAVRPAAILAAELPPANQRNRSSAGRTGCKPVLPLDDASRTLAHESAVGHVTGRAEYVDDVAQRRQMLEIWPLCSPHAHAKILRRDASEARRVPGVCAVLLAEDVPGHNDVGVSRKDEVLLADTEVLYHGHLVAVVVGETLAACREAAALVQVEYEPLPAVLTVPEAIAAGSFHTEPNFMRRGDWRMALERCEHKLEDVFDFGGQEHFYLETHAAWAEWDGEGNVFISSSTQHPSEIQAIVAEVLHLPRNRVVVHAPRMGGGFGGKETQGNTWAALVALAALKTGRPVRVQLDRDVDMQLTGKRHPFHASFRAGFDGEGRLHALQCDLISNGGWSLDLSVPVTDRAMFHIDNAYYIPNVEVSGRVAKTHITSQTAFRGFGGPQGMLVIEEIMDRIARRLGLPPEEVRERNLYHGSGETNTTHYGEEIGDNRIQAIWHQLKATSELAARRAEISAWNAAHTGRTRGIAITPVKFGISFTLTSYNQAGALVLIYRDGTVQVNHGGTEMGQGLHTKVLGIAMRELGLPRERIRMMTTATDKVPNTSATAASSGSDLNGAAVCDACRQLRARLAPFAAKLLHERFGRPAAADELHFENAAVFAAGHPSDALPFAEVVEHAYQARVSLAASGFYATPGIHWDRAAGRGRPFHYYACGAAVTEVEVDGYTGMSKVRRVDILHDTGNSLNAQIDRGQIEGGFVQGMGWLTSEELRWDAQGRLLTHSASIYQIPAISDAPMDFRVALFENAEQPDVIHGSKAVGEPPLMLAISVREAIRDAIATFGQAQDTIRLASPATPEAVFAAIRMLEPKGIR